MKKSVFIYLLFPISVMWAQQDPHNHSDDEGGHKEEEARVVLDQNRAQRMGVRIEQAGPAILDLGFTTAGHITLNDNTHVNVRARFPGLVKAVYAQLGDSIEQNQPLALIESNASLQDYTLKAPAKGTVIERHTNVGDVSSNDALFVIADLDLVWARLHIFPGDVAAVEKGQRVYINTLEKTHGRWGSIELLLPTAEPISQSIIAIVLLENSERLWTPGMQIEGTIMISSKTVPVAVKEESLQHLEEYGSIVFVQKPSSSTYEARPVQIGGRSRGYVEVLEGLSAGEVYVSEGSFVIKAELLKASAEHQH